MSDEPRPGGVWRRARHLCLVAGGALAVLVVLLSAAAMRSVVVRDWIDLYDAGYVTSESGSLVVAIATPPRWPGYRRASARVVTPGEYIAEERRRVRWGSFEWFPLNTGRVPRNPPHGNQAWLDAAGLTVGHFLDGHTHVVLPYWLPIAAAAGPAGGLWWLAGQCRRRARRAADECQSCGYDLRHSPGRCPECGRSPCPTVPPRG